MIRNEKVKEMVEMALMSLGDGDASDAFIIDLISCIEEVLTADTEAREREAFEAAKELIVFQLTPEVSASWDGKPKYPTYADYLKSKEE